MANQQNKDAKAPEEMPEQTAAIPEGPDDRSLPAGVPDGTPLQTQDEDGTVRTEKIVHDKDEDGNVVGFHKE